MPKLGVDPVCLSPSVVMCMRVFTVVCVLILGVPAFAQTPGACEEGEAEGVLDVGDVYAKVFNNGNLFFGNESIAAYVVPRSTIHSPQPHSPISAAGVFVGGKVNGQVRTAGALYVNYEFRPGPLGPNGQPPTDCQSFDRIYTVSRDDITRYYQTNIASDDLRDWPVLLGAPVLDGDGIEGNYNIADGDQPAIRGDQMAWWVMNDASAPHNHTGSAALGIEIRAEAIASSHPNPALGSSTFYRYLITNRNSASIDSAYFSVFVDYDLGDAADDYVGTDTTSGIGFVYNANDPDQVYGTSPAAGITFLQGPTIQAGGNADTLGLTSTAYFIGGVSAPLTDPRNASEVYQSMQGTWTDGTPYTEGGYGYQTEGPVTIFAFPGDPVTGAFWSEESEGTGGGDRRMAVTTGPFPLAPGETQEIVFAIVFAQGHDRLDSIVLLRNETGAIKYAYALGFFEPSRVDGNVTPDFDVITLTRPHPNPFTNTATIRFSVPVPTAVRLSVYDVLGREVAVLADGEHSVGMHEVVWNGSNISPGVYIIRFEAAGEERTFSVVKTR